MKARVKVESSDWLVSNLDGTEPKVSVYLLEEGESFHSFDFTGEAYEFRILRVSLGVVDILIPPTLILQSHEEGRPKDLMSLGVGDNRILTTPYDDAGTFWHITLEDVV